MKRILFLLLLGFIISGCKERGSFFVDGVITGENKNTTIFLNRVDINTPVLIDSAKITKKGVFHFKIKASQTEFYQVGYSTEDFISILAEPGEEIKLRFNRKNLFENYSVTGSPGSEKIQILDFSLAETKRKIDSINVEYKKASTEPDFDVKGVQLEAELTKVIKNQRKNNIEFIINNLNSLASIKALYQRIDPDTYVLYDPKDLQYLKIVTDTLTRYYPDSRQVQALARDFEKEMNQMYSNRLQQMAESIPATELDPVLNDVAGKSIALSSLKGRYVLLTFWSIQSKECITENIQLKQFYKMYNKKGFEIYQINLDQSESDWKAAVRFDELPWINTREDDPLNPRYAMLFNVKNLPANYMFDKEGVIIGTNLHGRTLQLKLEQLFNK